MIEREFVTRKVKEFEIDEFIKDSLKGVGLSHTKIQRTPLGEKIVIFAARPGLIIGGGGNNIKRLTKDIKKKFNLENPQIEISEVENTNLVAQIVAEKIVLSLEKFGSVRFKGIGHKTMTDVMGAGARGVEILISGKIPSARAKVWRFYQGYLKKCGEPALALVDTSYKVAKLKSGIVGIKVSIMPPDVRLPDDIRRKVDMQPKVEETKEKDPVLEEIKERAEEASKDNQNEKERTKEQE
jgi:small subunit ribosomal protein S3